MLMKHYEQSSISYFFMLYRAHHTEILFCVTLPISGSPISSAISRLHIQMLVHWGAPSSSQQTAFDNALTPPLLSQLPPPSLPFLFLGKIWWNPNYATVWVSLPHESRALVLSFCVADCQNSSVALRWWRIDEAGWENKPCHKSGLLRR